MTSLVWIAVVLAGATGAVLVLAEVPWFQRRPTVERLSPYLRAERHAGGPRRSADSLTQVLAPLAQQLGSRLSQALGFTEDLGLRLERAGMSLRPAEFRVRQLTRGIVALLLAGVVVIGIGPRLVMAAALLLGAPSLVVLGEEQRLSVLAARRQAALRAELPVVVEQLGMLLSAGYSLSGALSRLSTRSGGVVAHDLRTVIRNVRHGSNEGAALEEWGQRSGVDAVRRLVAVLSLHGATGDLGALISAEARAVRAEAQRELLESIERRAQLVWVPVTVATLVPGLIFLAVPFISAMSQVTGS